jgi:hypothetical protein
MSCASLSHCASAERRNATSAGKSLGRPLLSYGETPAAPLARAHTNLVPNPGSPGLYGSEGWGFESLRARTSERAHLAR